MNSIAFFDTEVQPDKNRILDIGCIRSDESTFHQGSVKEFIAFPVK
jgi:ATP-dependent DNA helicase RecQ